MHRRKFMQNIGVGALGLSLPSLLSAQQTMGNDSVSPRADACIVIYLNGGSSHLDTWDMKPDGPQDIRGEFKPIGSSLTGIQVCEHLPRMAKLMHRTTLIRSMHHSVNNSHAAAVYAALTGHDRGEQGGGAKPTDHPPPGAVLAKLRPPRGNALPYVSLPFKTKEGAGGPLQPGFLAGLIGARYDPFWVLEDPGSPTFKVRNLSLPQEISHHTLEERKHLLSAFDTGIHRQVNPSLPEMDAFQQQAFDLLTARTTQQAFQLSREPNAVRDRYGRNIYGQSVLLARRLIEAGTRVVTMSWAPDANATWDTHGGNFTKLKDTLLPELDAAYSSLIEDLSARGMLERTVVAVLTDFGRTPKINKGAGRDHWNACYSILLAGGGVKEGYVHGASDRTGARPSDAPVSPGDIVATLYTLLGVDPQDVLYDSLGRPHRIAPEGTVIQNLLA